ncbi:hypothetical protein GTA08_BOTSDO01284 [Neofusicoccum parvum]|nr:hypothetical protein GTA08_BOTSDO01284 [Neofusicoccum parvum]
MASYHVGPPSNVGNLTYQPPMIPYDSYPPTGPGVMMHPPPAPRPSHRLIPSAGMALAQQRQQQQQNRQQQAMATYHQPPQPGRSSATPVPSMAVNHQLPSIQQRADPAPRMRATNSPFNLPPAMTQTTPVHSQQQPQQHQPPAHHHSLQQQNQQPQQQRQQPHHHHHHPPTAAPTLPQPPLIEPHPLSPSLADLKLIAHPIPPTLLPHLSLTTSSSLARLFLDFEYRDLSATDYAIPDIHPAQRAWLAAHLRALNAARRESGVRLVAHWQRLVREGVEDGEGVPGGREEELRRLDWVAREVYGRCADGTRLPVLVWEYVQLRQVRGPSAKEWEDFVVDAVGEVWRMKERRERARRGVENGEEGEEEGRGAGEVSTVRVGGGVVGEAELKAAMKERHQRQRSVEVVDVPPAGVSKMRSPPRTAGAAGRQRSSTVVKPKPVKFAQSKTPKKRGGKKGSKGQVMFQAPLAGSSGSAINPIAVDSDLPDYPDDYGSGNMVAVTDKYSIAAYSSSGPDRTVTAQNTAGQILNYPETPDTKPTEQFLGSQNATATSTTVDHSSTTPAPAPQLLDYPPIFSTDAESTHATTQQNIAAPSTLNTNNSPHTPTNASPNFPEGYMNSSGSQQPTITPDKHSAVATTSSPSTPQNTATHMPIPPPSAATDTPSGGTGNTTPQPGPLPSADNTQPGAAPAPSKLPPAASPADPPAPHPPQIQVNSQDIAVSQLDGAFDVSDEVLDALFNGVLEGP